MKVVSLIALIASTRGERSTERAQNKKVKSRFSKTTKILSRFISFSVQPSLENGIKQIQFFHVVNLNPNGVDYRETRDFGVVKAVICINRKYSFNLPVNLINLFFEITNGVIPSINIIIEMNVDQSILFPNAHHSKKGIMLVCHCENGIDVVQFSYFHLKSTWSGKHLSVRVQMTLPINMRLNNFCQCSLLTTDLTVLMKSQPTPRHLNTITDTINDVTNDTTDIPNVSSHAVKSKYNKAHNYCEDKTLFQISNQYYIIFSIDYEIVMVMILISNWVRVSINVGKSVKVACKSNTW
jgi:hypothetical protein